MRSLDFLKAEDKTTNILYLCGIVIDEWLDEFHHRLADLTHHIHGYVDLGLQINI